MTYRTFTDGELRLAKQDPKLQDAIIQNYQKVAYKYAYYYANHTSNPNWDWDDYYDVALYGIYYAIHYYDVDNFVEGVSRKFTSLVFLCVRSHCRALVNTYFIGRTNLTKEERHQLLTHQISLDSKPPESENCEEETKELLVDTELTPCQQLLNKELWSLVNRHLSREDYEMLQLRFIEGLSYKAIGEKYLLPQHTVRRRIFLSLERLKSSPSLTRWLAAS